jgi:hypothetical protein
MTCEEFLEAFAGVADQFKWHCTGGIIRCRSIISGLTMWPITAYRSTLEDGKEYISSYYRKAAKDLGIAVNDSNILAGAADHDWDDTEARQVRAELFSIIQNKKRA